MRYLFGKALPGCLGIGIVLSGISLLFWLGFSALLGGTSWPLHAVGLGIVLIEIGFLCWVWRRLHEAREIDRAHERGEHDAFMG